MLPTMGVQGARQSVGGSFAVTGLPIDRLALKSAPRSAVSSAVRPSSALIRL